MRRSRILRVVGYVAFSLAAFVLCLYLTFPAQVVGDRVSHAVAKTSRGVWSVSFDDVSLYGLTGFEASGVHIRKSSIDGGGLDLTLDALRMRLQILPLFLLRTSFSATAVLGDGELSVQARPGEAGAMDLQLEADRLRLESPPVLEKLTGLALGGELIGTLEGHWSGRPGDSSGKTTLTIRQAKVGPGTIAGFTIPAIDLGQLDLSLDMKAGRLAISSFKQQGGHLSAKLSGSSAVRAQAGAMTLDVCAQLKADEAFLRDNPKLRTALQLAEVKLRKDKDGYLHVPLTGTVSRPRLRGGLCRRRER